MNSPSRQPWNKGKLIGQKAPLNPPSIADNQGLRRYRTKAFRQKR